MLEGQREKSTGKIPTPSKARLDATEVDTKKMEMPKPEAAEEGFNIGDSFKVGWEIFKDNMGMLILTLIIVLTLQIASEVISLILTNKGQGGLSVLVSLILSIAQIIVEIGMVNIFLRAYDKKNIGVEDLFSKIDKIWVFIGVGIVMNFIIMGGTVLLLVPGAIAMVALLPTVLIVVDRKMGVMDVIKTSWEITQGNKGNLFVFLVVGLVFNFLGFIALGIGLLVTSPVTFLAIIHVYRKLFTQAERKKKIPVEKLQTVPKVFLWIGILIIPVGIIASIILGAIGSVREGIM